MKILAQLTRQEQSSVGKLFSRLAEFITLTAAGETTWYDFACAVLDEAVHLSPAVDWFAEATRGRPLIPEEIIPITTAEYPNPGCASGLFCPF